MAKVKTDVRLKAGVKAKKTYKKRLEQALKNPTKVSKRRVKPKRPKIA